MSPLSRKITPIPLCSQELLHPRYRLGFCVKGPEMHDLHAEAFVHSQELNREQSSFFLRVTSSLAL